MTRYWVAHEFEGTQREAIDQAVAEATSSTRTTVLTGEPGEGLDTRPWERISEVYGGRE